MRLRRAMFRAVPLALLLSSCRLFRPVNPNGPAPVNAPAAAAPAAETAPSRAVPRPVALRDVTDGNIAAMLLALNNTDISYARLVPSRSQRDDVRRFAQRMLTDHTGVNAAVRDLLRTLDLEPVDNETSLDLRDESDDRRDRMRDLEGRAFDSTYISNEVDYHTKFLTQLDGVMIPAARHEQLRTLLTHVRPAVAAHLAHAEQVRADVLKPAGRP